MKNRLSALLILNGTIFILLLLYSFRSPFQIGTFLLSSAGLLVVIYISLRLIRSLSKLEMEMSNFRPITDKTFKEMDLIFTHYQSLLDQNLNLKEELKQKKMKIIYSELNRSQTEINPHFLYNTLDSIYWMAKREDMIDISEMILNLSNFFRLSLHRGAHTIPLWEEIKNLHYYLEIQQSRFMNRFTFHIDMSEKTKEMHILKKLIQPLVENCFIHGLERKPDKGTIWIRSRILQDLLFIEIEDNGMGMDENRLSYVREELQKINIETVYNIQNYHDNEDVFGMRNVKSRLLLFYGQDAELCVKSEQNKGTQVVLKIPISHVINLPPSN